MITNARKEYLRKYRVAHKSERSEYKRAYDEAHRTEIAEYMIVYYESHKTEWAVRNKEYSKAHPEQYREYSQMRRARIAGATVEDIPDDLKQILIGLYGSVCMHPDCAREDVTIDHIIPLSKGGKHSMDNFQLLCKSHNSGKGSRNSIDYRENT